MQQVTIRRYNTPKGNNDSKGKTTAPEGGNPQTEDKEKSKPKMDTPPKELGGPSGPEPTRYGDWERKGRVSDF